MPAPTQAPCTWAVTRWPRPAKSRAGLRTLRTTWAVTAVGERAELVEVTPAREIGPGATQLHRAPDDPAPASTNASVMRRGAGR